MPYSCTLESLFSALSVEDREGAAWLRARYRNVEQGLLPVGLKIHILPSAYDSFKDLARVLKGAANPALFDLAIDSTSNIYRLEHASVCLVLPPVGSARAAIRLLDCLGRCVREDIWANHNIQVQICSPGRLDSKRSALLGTVFYLCSDSFRTYSLEELKTTVQFDERYLRSPRLVIYDGYNNRGDFDPNFEFWARCSMPAPLRLAKLPMASNDLMSSLGRYTGTISGTSTWLRHS